MSKELFAQQGKADALAGKTRQREGNSWQARAYEQGYVEGVMEAQQSIADESAAPKSKLVNLFNATLKESKKTRKAAEKCNAIISACRHRLRMASLAL